MIAFSGSGSPGQSCCCSGCCSYRALPGPGKSTFKGNWVLLGWQTLLIFPSAQIVMGTFTKVLLSLLFLLSSGVMESAAPLSIFFLSTRKNYCAHKTVLSRPWNSTGWLKKKEYVQVRKGWLQAGNQSFLLNYSLLMRGAILVNPGVIPLEFSDLYLQIQTSRKTYQNHGEINLLNYATAETGESHEFPGFTLKNSI